MNQKDLKYLDNEQVLNLRNQIDLLWHYRLNHSSKMYLEIVSNVIPNLKGVKFDSNIINCEICNVAKIKQNPSTEQRARSNKPLKLIRTDLMSVVRKDLQTNSRQIVTFTDDYSQFATAYNSVDKISVHFAL